MRAVLTDPVIISLLFLCDLADPYWKPRHKFTISNHPKYPLPGGNHLWIVGWARLVDGELRQLGRDRAGVTLSRVYYLVEPKAVPTFDSRSRGPKRNDHDDMEFG